MNILFTTLSVLHNTRQNTYYCKELPENEGEGIKTYYYYGTQQQEPDAKYILSHFEIDKIVCLGSKEVLDDKKTNCCLKLSNAKELYDRYCVNGEARIIAEYSTWEYFLTKIYKYQFVGDYIGDSDKPIPRSKNFGRDIDIEFGEKYDSNNLYSILNNLY